MTTINVTAEHIADGFPRDCVYCPVALAIKDALPDIAAVNVTAGTVTILPTPQGPWINLRTPDDVARFILDLDEGYHVGEPFSFEMDYPAEVAA